MYAAAPSCSDRIYQQIAPAIFGHADIKKAIACLLFGGTRKVRAVVSGHEEQHPSAQCNNRHPPCR